MAKKPLVEDKRLQMRVKSDWLERIDVWRRTQSDLPNLSEAIRRLVDMALASGPKPKQRLQRKGGKSGG